MYSGHIFSHKIPKCMMVKKKSLMMVQNAHPVILYENFTESPLHNFHFAQFETHQCPGLHRSLDSK